MSRSVKEKHEGPPPAKRPKLESEVSEMEWSDVAAQPSSTGSASRGLKSETDTSGSDSSSTGERLQESAKENKRKNQKTPARERTESSDSDDYEATSSSGSDTGDESPKGNEKTAKKQAPGARRATRRADRGAPKSLSGITIQGGIRKSRNVNLGNQKELHQTFGAPASGSSDSEAESKKEKDDKATGSKKRNQKSSNKTCEDRKSARTDSRRGNTSNVVIYGGIEDSDNVNVSNQDSVRQTYRGPETRRKNNSKQRATSSAANQGKALGSKEELRTALQNRGIKPGDIPKSKPDMKALLHKINKERRREEPK